MMRVFGAPVGGQVCRKFQVSDISSSSEASATSGRELGLRLQQDECSRPLGWLVKLCANAVERIVRAGLFITDKPATKACICARPAVDTWAKGDSHV
jgi:hypothetical protein